MEEEEEMSDFIRSTLEALKGHVSNKNAQGARVESYLFRSAMDDYKAISTSPHKVEEFKKQYLETMNNGGHSLIGRGNLPQ